MVDVSQQPTVDKLSLQQARYDFVGHSDGISVASPADETDANGAKRLSMDKYLPASFLESLGGGLAIVAVVAGGVSLIPSLRVHNLRMMAILIIASIALFSNNVSTYFVAMFVIATAVTEIEFLQTLAAIISGNKDYFDLQKEALSTEKKLSALAKEVKQSEILTEGKPESSKVEENSSESSQDRPGGGIATEEEAKQGSTAGEVKDSKGDASAPNQTGVFGSGVGTSEKISTDSSGGELAQSVELSRASDPDANFGRDYVERIYGLETKAFDKLEGFYMQAIERGIRLRRGGGITIEVDGLIINAGSETDVAFEVKYLRTSRNFISWTKMVGRQVGRIRTQYKEVTRKEVNIHFVLVLEKGVKLTFRQRDAIQDVGADTFSVFTAEYLEDGIENNPWASSIQV